MDIAIGVVGHTKRATQAADLMDSVGAIYRSVDNGTLGCNANHRKVWTRLTRYNTDWSIVLEDDAQPVEGFRTQLDQALTTAPTDVVSLYLGTSRPPQWQHKIREAIKQADKLNACWITTQGFIHGVAVAIRTELIPDMLDHTQECLKGFDFGIRDWARNTHRYIAFAWPSPVDHRDSPTLIARHPDGQPRLRPRTAHRFAARNTWNSTAVEI